MKFKLASIIIAIYCIVGIGLIIFSEFENKPILNLLSYILVFILIPTYGAYTTWNKNKKGILICSLFFLSQSIRLIGGESWFPYSPPMSLGIPFGSFANGQGYLIDFFAIAMAILLAWLLWILTTSEHK